MQDQGKRLLLAVAIALGVLLVWNVVFPPEKPDQPAKSQGSGEVLTPPPSPDGPGAPAADVAAAAAEVARGEEQRITLTFPRFEATFSSYGGTLASFKLTDKRFRLSKDKTPHPDGELLPLVPETGTFAVNFARGSTHFLPVHGEWKGEKLSDTEVRYTLSTPHLDVTKSFQIVPDAYLVRMDVKATVKDAAGKVADQALAVSAFAFQDPKNIEKGAGQGGDRAWHSSTLRAEEIFHTPVTALIKQPRFEDKLTWTGFEHPYLLVAYAPRPQAGQVVEKFTSADATGLMRTDLVLGKAKLENGGSIAGEVVAYLGPKNYTTLEAADDAAGFATNFRETVDLGWFGFIGKPLLWLLQQFYALFGNWGIAIILLTFLVKAATLYWTTKSMRSMKAMAALAPQMKELQAKYKDDRQRLQAETMALYKTHNVNPIAGCLPILMQMPVWLALYRMLSSAGELYQRPFIPGWINDLTAADPYYVLPFVLLVTMFAQARLTPATGDSTQQKFLQYGMPLMFGVMAFFFPAGLTLYIFTNTILSALHSIYMNKFDKASLAMAARVKQSVDAAAAKDVAAAKPAGGKPAAGKAASKGVIDADAVEHDDNDEDAEGEPATGGTASGPARSRNKRKKRRR